MAELVGEGSVINGAYPVYFMKKYKKPDTLSVINYYNFVTDGHWDSMTQPAQRAESVKIRNAKYSK